MAFTAGSFEVTTTAQKVLDAVGLPGAVEIVNPSSNTVTVWIGGSDVTVDDGRPIEPGDPFAFDFQGDDDVYIIASEAVTVFRTVVTT